MTTDPVGTGLAIGRRSDAQRNRRRVIVAARELFIEHGLSVTVPQVAERAGVGKATVYRSYPTKQDLVIAVTVDQFQALERRVQAAHANQASDQAFGALVQELFAMLVEDRVLADAFFAGHIPPAATILSQIGHLLDRAREYSSIPPGAGERDVRVVLCGTVRQLIALDERDSAAWQRYAEIIFTALLPPRGR